jgi:hypothetical protein
MAQPAHRSNAKEPEDPSYELEESLTEPEDVLPQTEDTPNQPADAPNQIDNDHDDSDDYEDEDLDNSLLKPFVCHNIKVDVNTTKSVKCNESYKIRVSYSQFSAIYQFIVDVFAINILCFSGDSA